MEYIADQSVDIDVTPMVQGFMEDFNGVPYPQFFGNKQAYKTISFWNRVNWLIKLIGSIVFAATPFNSLKVLLERFSGDWSEVGFINKFIWGYYRLTSLNYDALVV